MCTKKDPYWCSVTELLRGAGDHCFAEWWCRRMWKYPECPFWLVSWLPWVVGWSTCSPAAPIVAVLVLVGPRCTLGVANRGLLGLWEVAGGKGHKEPLLSAYSSVDLADWMSGGGAGYKVSRYLECTSRMLILYWSLLVCWIVLRWDEGHQWPVPTWQRCILDTVDPTISMPGEWLKHTVSEECLAWHWGTPCQCGWTLIPTILL